MTNLPGGPADKAGNNYETLWGVDEMLNVLAGRADRIRIEPPTEDGIEFYVESENSRQYYQAKRQRINSTWTINALTANGVLENFLRLVEAGFNCVFVSITDAPVFRQLSASIRSTL